MFYPELLTDEERKLQEEVRIFVREQVPHELVVALDRDEIEYPREFVKLLGDNNLLGLRFDPKWGGRGLPWTSEVIAEEEIGVLGTTLGCAYVMPSIVGEALQVFGTEMQKERFLKPLLRGEMIAAEALTEPRGGSDFFGATCKAERKGETFLVNGQKRFVVGATQADIFLVYCRTNFEEDAHKHQRISAILVERGPGVKTEYQYGLMGTRGGGTGRLIFHDVEVPTENLIGDLHGGAEVFNQMMIPERLTSAAACLGVRAALDIAARYSDKRKAFGQKIRRFQGVNFMVADAITQLDAARALVYMAAKAVDEDAPNRRRLVSEAKKFATDTAWQVSNLAMQIMGGIGYTDVYPIERMVRDYRLAQIWTGTNQIMNLLIQHEYYKEILENGTNQRDSERDALSFAAEGEKVFADEDQR
jgi:alkylation response protein AidB-like acyl-CoA dehydrogenase